MSRYNQYRELAIVAIWEHGDYVTAIRHLGKAFAQPDFRNKHVCKKQSELRGFCKVARADLERRKEEAGSQRSRELMQTFADTSAKVGAFTSLIERQTHTRLCLRTMEVAVSEMERTIDRACNSRHFPAYVFDELVYRVENVGL